MGIVLERIREIKRQRETKQELGKILSHFARLDADESIMHEDVSAWGAPSECNTDVSRGCEAKWLRKEQCYGEFRDLMDIAREIVPDIQRRYGECVYRMIKRDSPWR